MKKVYEILFWVVAAPFIVAISMGMMLIGIGLFLFVGDDRIETDLFD
jgi:hypothetical protein